MADCPWTGKFSPEAKQDGLYGQDGSSLGPERNMPVQGYLLLTSLKSYDNRELRRPSPSTRYRETSPNKISALANAIDGRGAQLYSRRHPRVLI